MISLVLTVLNEAKSLPALLDSFAAQTRLPDEVVVCDGGSRDATPEMLRAESRFLIRVVSEPGANISRGRNCAIAAAHGEIIACTDAGVRLERDWLERITAPLLADETRAVCAGFFVPDAATTFETAMSATVLPAPEDIAPEKFLPSSRSVAFRKSAWQAVGGYPEWLDYCEDLIFDLNLRQKFGAFAFQPRAIAHFRPRGSFRSFFKQYYLYARGDGKAGLFFKRHVIRYATYLVALPVLLIGLGMGLAAGNALLWMACAALLAVGVAAYCRMPFRRLRHLWMGLPPVEKLKAAALIPAIRVVGDVAKMCGYPVGIIWKLKIKN